MFNFLKNYFKPKERKQYILPLQKDITVYFDGYQWYDCIINSYAIGFNNEQPLLVEGTIWDPLKFKNFKTSKNVFDVLNLSYVDPQFISKNITDEFIYDSIVRINNGFLKINSFIPYTKKFYNCLTQENETYVMWIVNDSDFTFAMLLNNLKKDSNLLIEVKEHLLEVPTIKEKEKHE